MNILKFGNLNIRCFSQSQIDRLPYAMNNLLRINVPNTLVYNEKYGKYINERTMGTLNNWAEHEKINIYFTPLENDLFDDLKVMMFKNNYNTGFTMSLPKEEKRSNVADFLKELYTKAVEHKNKMK